MDGKLLLLLEDNAGDIKSIICKCKSLAIFVCII